MRHVLPDIIVSQTSCRWLRGMCPDSDIVCDISGHAGVGGPGPITAMFGLDWCNRRELRARGAVMPAERMAKTDSCNELDD